MKTLLSLITLLLISTSAFAMSAQPHSPERMKCEFDAIDSCNLELFGNKAYKIYHAPLEDRLKHAACTAPKYKECESL